MSAIEINKIVGALLSTALFLMLINMLSDVIFEPYSDGKAPTYLVETSDEQRGATAVVQEVGPTLDILLATATSESGEKISKKCIACHTFAQGQASRIGPNLWDILGRDIASGAGFEYSKALLKIEGAWNFVELDKFLRSPKKYANGTKMAFPGLKKPTDRADVIMYLRSLSAAPVTLPDQ